LLFALDDRGQRILDRVLRRLDARVQLVRYRFAAALEICRLLAQLRQPVLLPADVALLELDQGVDIRQISVTRHDQVIDALEGIQQHAVVGALLLTHALLLHTQPLEFSFTLDLFRCLLRWHGVHAHAGRREQGAALVDFGRRDDVRVVDIALVVHPAIEDLGDGRGCRPQDHEQRNDRGDEQSDRVCPVPGRGARYDRGKGVAGQELLHRLGTDSGLAACVLYPSHTGFRSRCTLLAPDRCVTPPRHRGAMTRRRALRSGTRGAPRFPENLCATGIATRSSTSTSWTICQRCNGVSTTPRRFFSEP
jgi:hypothetical protein